MASIDERVVAMAFENAKFEAGIAQTMAGLAKLNESLANIGKVNGLSGIETAANKVTLTAPMSALDKLRAKLGMAGDTKGFSDIQGASEKVTLAAPMSALDKLRSKLGFIGDTKGFADIEKASDKVTLSGVNTAIEKTAGNFSILTGAAAVAFGTIAAQATLAMGKSVTQSLNMIKDGFSDYELKIGATQTIMAGTGEGIGEVTKYLKDLDIYADRTIYNLRDMTGNIGKFTNAGVKLPVAVEAMKGIANLAALSGANTEEAARAMYNLGQSIGQGTVRLADWRSIDLANMGTKEFKEQLIEAALAAGTLTKGADGTIKSLKGNEVNFKTFGVTLQDQWLTAEALTKTLNKYSDETTDLGRRAYAAASDVKTMSMMFTTLKAAAGTGWTDTFDIIIGDLPEATKLWTGITNVIGGAMGRSADARNEMLKDWDALGGRKDLIEGIKNVFEALGSVLKPIKEAFREIFPKKTGEDLAELTKKFRDFAEHLKISPETAENLRRTFAGLFAVLSIGKTIVGHIIRSIFNLLGVVGQGSGGFLNLTGSIGDFLVSLDQAITKGDSLRDFFDGLSLVLHAPLELLVALASAFFSLFDGADSSKADNVSSSLDTVGESLKPLKGILDLVVAGWEKLVDILGQVKGAVQPLLDNIATAFSTFGTVVSNSLNNVNFEAVFSGLQTGLLAGIFVALKKGLSGFDVTGGLMGNINSVLKGVTGNLTAMQTKIHAEALLAIAAAIAVLAAGIFLLSKINGDDLSRAMTAVAVGLGELMGAMKLMTTGLAKTSILQLPVIAASLVILAGAVVVLAAAMKIFSTISWEGIAKGLAGVGGSLVAVGLGTKLIGPGITLIGPGLLALAVAMNVLAVAVKIFATMSWEELAKGILGVGGALTALGFGLTLIGPSVLVVGPGLVAVALAMNLLSGAVRSFGGMNLLDMGKGILGIAAALIAIGFSIALIPPTVALQAAGLVILAVALTGIAGAIKVFGSMDILSMVKGIAALAATLVVLAIGLSAMAGTIPGSVALLGAATALAILAPTLAFLGTLKWSTIFKGLAAIALALGTLAVVGALAAAPLSALGIALLPLAAAFVVVAGATYIFAKALQLLGSEGAKGVAVMVAALTAFIALLPKIVIDFIKGLVEIIAAAAKLAPEVVTALGVIIGSVLAIVTDAAPKMAVAMGAVILALLTVLTENAPRIIAAGYKLLTDFLSGIANNIGQVTAQVADIIVKFLTELTHSAPSLTAAGAAILVAFLLGITNKIPALVESVVKLITAFVNTVASKISRIVQAAGNLMVKFIAAISSYYSRLITAGTNLILNFIEGVGKAGPRIISAAVSAAEKFAKALSKGLVKLVDIGFETMIDFMNGLANSIRKNNQAMIDAGFNIADAIIDGLFNGLTQLGPKIIDKVGDLIGDLPKKALSILGIHSPSKVFMEIGKFTMLGLAKGLDDSSGLVDNSGKTIGNSVINSFRETFGIHSPSEVMREIGKFVGQGFAQGLTGSQDDIRNAFTSLDEKLHDSIRTAKETIASEQAKIDDLLKAKKPDYTAIKEAQKIIDQNEAVLKKSRAAHTALTVALKDEKDALLGLTKDYEDVSKKLGEAQTALDNATRVRDDAKKSLTDKFSTTPTIDKDSKTSVQDYVKALKEQITATKSYSETLAKLRALGLDDETYQKLLDEGLAGKDFAESLLKGGKTAVDGVNKLDAELLAASTTLAQNAATTLYQAGVDAAQGLVNGLTSKKAELEKMMTDLAEVMVAAIKKKLKIKSPSQIFAEVGGNMMSGLSSGIDKGSGGVTSAMEGVAENVVDTAESSLGRLRPDLMFGVVDMEPVITPVLDLSSVKKSAKGLSDLTNVTPITAAASFGMAGAISQEKQASDVAQVDQAAEASKTFNFEQNNYSPESLSDVEIYRQTNNQLSQLKSVIGMVP